MKKLPLFVLSVIILTILCSKAHSKETVTYNVIDEFLKNNPEYVADTILVDISLPEIQLDNPVVNTIMEKDLLPKLRSYKSDGKIILSLAVYPADDFSVYSFQPVTPGQAISDIVSDGNSLTNIVAYTRYDDIYLLLTNYFKNEITESDTILHKFKLKLFKKMSDLRCEWVYMSNDTIIKIFYSPDYPQYNDSIWRCRIIKMMERMDEHDF